MAPPWAEPAPLPLLPSTPRTRLPRKAQPETASVPAPTFARPPPKALPGLPNASLEGSPTASLSDRTSPVSVRLPRFRIPPPTPASTGELSLARPFVIVIPAMVEVTPALMSKTRLAWLPLTVSCFAPGPSMSRLLVMASSPPVSVMVWPRRLGEKLMVSPLWAAAISPRSEPSPRAPVSRLLVTVKVLGIVRSSSASRCNRAALDPGVRPAEMPEGRDLRESNRVRNRMVVSFVVCSRVTTALSVRRPCAGAVPGRWGACLAVRTPPTAFSCVISRRSGSCRCRGSW